MDYVDRLAAEIGSPPSIERAQAIANRLPLTLRVDGPQIHWASHPDQQNPDWVSDKVRQEDRWTGDENGHSLLRRTTADGHHIEFGLNALSWDKRPRIAWGTLTVLLLLTALAYVYVRHLLRPLDDIRQGAQRFGNGNFAQPIPVRHAHRPDELGQLAETINTMGDDIHQMLEAKRALLLAMSHELRSPLTRARLNTELLPETADVQPQRLALMRDLGEMAGLITDLLESERLAGRHAALHREPTDVTELAREVVADLCSRHAGAADIALHVAPDLPSVRLDRSRLRLLLRNLLDNSLRHSESGAFPLSCICGWRMRGGCWNWRCVIMGAVCPPSTCHTWPRRSTARTPHANVPPAASDWVCTCAGWWRRRTTGNCTCAMQSLACRSPCVCRWWNRSRAGGIDRLACALAGGVAPTRPGQRTGLVQWGSGHASGHVRLLNAN